jgi:hypothetical protein
VVRALSQSGKSVGPVVRALAQWKEHWPSGNSIGPDIERSHIERSEVRFPNCSCVKPLGKFLILHCPCQPSSNRYLKECKGKTVARHQIRIGMSVFRCQSEGNVHSYGLSGLYRTINKKLIKIGLLIKYIHIPLVICAF